MFAGAAEALAAAVAMQHAPRSTLLGRHEAVSLLGLRVGISAGDVTLEDGDCFGAPVVEASRLSAAAEADTFSPPRSFACWRAEAGTR